MKEQRQRKGRIGNARQRNSKPYKAAGKYSAKEGEWSYVVDRHRVTLAAYAKELWHYRDLIKFLVRRDYIINYVQTILGPLWFVIQPLLSAVVFTFVFGRVVKLSTDQLPPFLFYMSGSILWSYFAMCFQKIATNFVDNKDWLRKIYFPRLSMPIAILLSSLGRFFLNVLIFFAFLCYYIFAEGHNVHVSWLSILLIPCLVFQMAVISLGSGLIIASLSVKYKDLLQLMTFVVQLWMYCSPIVYPLSQVPQEYRSWYACNPMSAVIESFRMLVLGKSSLHFHEALLSWGISIVSLLIGLYAFQRTQRNFVDTI